MPDAEYYRYIERIIREVTRGSRGREREEPLVCPGGFKVINVIGKDVERGDIFEKPAMPGLTEKALLSFRIYEMCPTLASVFAGPLRLSVITMYYNGWFMAGLKDANGFGVFGIGQSEVQALNDAAVNYALLHKVPDDRNPFKLIVNYMNAWAAAEAKKTIEAGRTIYGAPKQPSGPVPLVCRVSDWEGTLVRVEEEMFILCNNPVQYVKVEVLMPDRTLIEERIKKLEEKKQEFMGLLKKLEEELKRQEEQQRQQQAQQQGQQQQQQQQKRGFLESVKNALKGFAEKAVEAVKELGEKAKEVITSIPQAFKGEVEPEELLAAVKKEIEEGRVKNAINLLRGAVKSIDEAIEKLNKAPLMPPHPIYIAYFNNKSWHEEKGYNTEHEFAYGIGNSLQTALMDAAKKWWDYHHLEEVRNPFWVVLKYLKTPNEVLEVLRRELSASQARAELEKALKAKPVPKEVAEFWNKQTQEVVNKKMKSLKEKSERKAAKPQPVPQVATQQVAGAQASSQPVQQATPQPTPQQQTTQQPQQVQQAQQATTQQTAPQPQQEQQQQPEEETPTYSMTESVEKSEEEGKKEKRKRAYTY